MPSRNEIFHEVTKQKNEALGQSKAMQDVVRRQYLNDLAAYTQRDTIIMSSSFTSVSIAGMNIPSTFLSISNADIQGFMSSFHNLKNDKLDIIIHSPGGTIDAAEQIVNYMRSKYDHIRAIIPQNAMSAATMIACACDEIIMGKHSAIGPIDPQISYINPDGTPFSAPAQAILDEFERAKLEIANDPESAAVWVRRMDRYPIGFLQICDNSIDRSKKCVSEWLSKWMLKDNPNKRLPRKISNWLCNTKEHITHGKPINKDVASEHGLKVISLEEDGELQDKVLSVFHATMATHEMTHCVKLIENHEGKGAYLTLNIEKN